MPQAPWPYSDTMSHANRSLKNTHSSSLECTLCQFLPPRECGAETTACSTLLVPSQSTDWTTVGRMQPPCVTNSLTVTVHHNVPAYFHESSPVVQQAPAATCFEYCVSFAEHLAFVLGAICTPYLLLYSYAVCSKLISVAIALVLCLPSFVSGILLLNVQVWNNYLSNTFY